MDAAARHDAIVALLRREARAGVVSFARLVEVALYAPGLGYYASERVRVGKAAGTDFTTAAALGPMFGQLIAGAAKSLVGELHTHALVEVGAEPGQAHYAGVASRFAELRTFRFGATPDFPARSVLVANELLDAQPFHRFVRQHESWRELGVRVDGAELTVEPLTDYSTPLAADFARSLPQADEGWIIDAPLAAEELLRKLLSGGWSGAVILLDYGKTIAQCLESSPAGTARAYRSHQLSGAILESLGSQDLTCHVLWDRIEPVLLAAGFKGVRLDRQEAFFVKYAAGEMEQIALSGDHEATGRLRALTHPAHFGAKFQVLHGVRG
ncbi:MAG: SAM-dependent methyltransferase [Opitutales bacterium]|nr:SAM-dependent methyltransferase [Opitutales bacterium]